MVYFGNATILGDTGARSAAHERIAEIIKDLNPELELAWIPPENRSAFDKHTFAVVHVHPNGQRYVVFTMPEDEVDHRVIARIINTDTSRKDVLKEMEANEAALRLVQAKAAMEEIEEKRDFVHSVIGSKKHRYKHNGQVYT